MKQPKIGSRWVAKSTYGQPTRGSYRVTGFARGAGSLHGQRIVVYRNAEHEQFVRPLGEWYDRMEALS